MPKIDELINEIPRKEMILFYIIDTSSNTILLYLFLIKSQNIAIFDLLGMTNADCKVKIAVLDFASGAEWQNFQPVDIEKFNWNDLRTNKQTNSAETCTMLFEKLPKTAFINDTTGNCTNAIILISDGYPTDNYKNGLEHIKKNNWFKNSLKVALAVDADSDKNILADFTGNKESVIEIHNQRVLTKIIRFVCYKAYWIVSYYNIVSEDKGSDISPKQQQFIDSLNEINDFLLDEEDDDEVEW